MNFGDWVRQKRKEEGLEVQNLAKKSGVDAATISRIEHESAEPTVYTVARICQALQVTPSQIIVDLLGKKYPPSVEAEPSSTMAKSVLNIYDIEAFLEFDRMKPEKALRLMSELFNQTFELPSRIGRPYFLEFSTKDIRRLIFSSPYFIFDLNYPKMDASTILEMFRLGGVLTQIDLGTYISERRRKKKITLTDLELSTGHSDSALSRLQRGRVELMKLSNILVLDQTLGERGRILMMTWSICELMAQVDLHRPIDAKPDSDPHRRPEQLASALIKTFRWRQRLGVECTQWLGDLRNKIGIASSSN